jgi:hypothetical protein
MTTNPSDRAMKCAEELNAAGKLARWPELPNKVAEVAQIIDRHYGELVDSLSRYLEMPSLDGKPDRQQLRAKLNGLMR